MSECKNIVGPVIRDLRGKKGLAQAQLAAKLNLLSWDVSRGTLAKIEAQVRCVTDYELPILAAALGIEPTELLRLAIANAPKRTRS